MAKHSRLEVLSTIKEVGLLPVFYNSDFEVSKNVLCACADGGARAIEFTNRGDRAINIFTKLAEFRDKERPDIIFGVGSVLDAPTAAMYIAAGADFVVAPILDEDVAKLCNSRKIPYSPGCGSLTEIHRAYTFGVEIVKVFPAVEVGGPGFIKAVRGPCPWVEIMPTGGVTPTEKCLSEWFDAGAVCVGMGSKLITKELVAAKDYVGISKNIKVTVDLIKKIKAGAK